VAANEFQNLEKPTMDSELEMQTLGISATVVGCSAVQRAPAGGC